MKKTICRALLCLLLAACLLPLTARTAHADKIYDEIVNYQVDVTPNTEDGSLTIQVTLDWKPLEDLPATNSQKGGAKIGIPNGSIREMTALTDNIQSIDHDNSLAYIDFTQSYDANETFRFAFRWVQEYMYTLSDSGAVSYDYTPGWFKEAPVDVMTLTWHDPASTAGVGSDGQTGGDHVLTASNMKPGDRLNFTVEYASWPSTLYWENSRDNLPDNSWGDDSYDDSDDSDDWVFSVFVIFVLVIFFVVRAAVYDGYAGGFGTRYVFVHGLWYPAGPDGRHPRPGSVGTKHKPAPPRSSGFGGGKRGGGFGGGFGGGGGPVVNRGIGSIHAGDLTDHSLVLKDGLEDALADLRLVRGVGGQELLFGGDALDNGGDVVVVGARTAEDGGEDGVFPCHFCHHPADFQFGFAGGDV